MENETRQIPGVFPETSQSVENPELAEASLKERDLVIEEFKRYIDEHQKEIENELHSGSDLMDIFYRNFYNVSNIKKYNATDFDIEKMVQDYDAEILKAKKTLREFQEKHAIKSKIYFDGWLRCVTNGGYRNQPKIGRLYFNLKPKYVGSFLVQLAKISENSGLHVQIKIPTEGSEQMFNRLDKMVMYFDAKEERGVLKVLEDIYSNNQAAFDETGTVKFTAKIKNIKGEYMKGVGFGEETAFGVDESFGTTRAGILAMIYNKAKRLSLSVSDPAFNFEASFQEACMVYKVNPKMPAFNSRNPENFSEIKKRMK